MTPGDLIPEDGMDAMTAQEWANAIKDLSEMIPNLATLNAMIGDDEDLALELTIETLLDLICLEKAKPWLAWIARNADLLNGLDAVGRPDRSGYSGQTKPLQRAARDLADQSGGEGKP